MMIYFQFFNLHIFSPKNWTKLDNPPQLKSDLIFNICFHIKRFSGTGPPPPSPYSAKVLILSSFFMLRPSLSWCCEVRNWFCLTKSREKSQKHSKLVIFWNTLNLGGCCYFSLDCKSKLISDFTAPTCPIKSSVLTPHIPMLWQQNFPSKLSIWSFSNHQEDESNIIKF